MSSVEFLEEERKKLWEAVSDLKESVSKKTSDYESEAVGARNKASQYRNQALESKEQAEKILSEIQNLQKELEIQKNAIQQELTNSNQQLLQTQSQSEEIKEIHSKIFELEIDSKLEQVKEALSQVKEITSLIEQTKKFSNESSDLKVKIQNLYKEAEVKNDEIHDLHLEIIGNQSEDEPEANTSGLKQRLEESFNGLKKDLSSFHKDLSNFKEEKLNEYNQFLKHKDSEYKDLVKRIETLLPGAMAAGLSSAYQAKREAEEMERKRADVNFFIAIGALSLISLIPLVLGICLIFKQKETFEVALQELAKLLPFLLPLYTPAGWVALSSSRKSNLSKRLIEEYTHKEVLSKTFEGLSKQVQDIEEEGVSNEFKLKLLHNLIEVSSENPGQLIQGYNKADHPVVDFVEGKVDDLTKLITKLAHSPIAVALAGEIIAEKKGKKAEVLDKSEE